MTSENWYVAMLCVLVFLPSIFFYIFMIRTVEKDYKNAPGDSDVDNQDSTPTDKMA